MGGVLADTDGNRRRDRGDEIERRRPQLEKWEAFCAELGETPADVALAWLLSRPAVTAPIVGPRTMEQLDSSLRALEVSLDADALARIDEIWPGFKTAPEDYAWKLDVSRAPARPTPTADCWRAPPRRCPRP